MMTMGRTRFRLLEQAVIFAVLATGIAGSAGCAQDSPIVTISSHPGNDLLGVLHKNGHNIRIVGSPEMAVELAPDGSGVLLLSNSYPHRTDDIDPGLLKRAADKGLKIYMEFSGNAPGVTSGTVHIADWERGVVSSDTFGPVLPRNSIVAVHDARFLHAKAERPWLVFARVAGVDEAVFGLSDTESWPVLYEAAENNMLVSTTRLSSFVSGRYAPREAWKTIWEHILAWVEPEVSWDLEWTPSVHPTFTKNDVLPADARRQAVLRGGAWYGESRMLVDSLWAHRIEAAAAFPDRTGTSPDLSLKIGDGSAGLLEGFSSRINHDGNQEVRWWQRADCTSESAMAIALSDQLTAGAGTGAVSGNLQDWLYYRSALQTDYSRDPADPEYGLIGWNTIDNRVYYGDDNARVLLGTWATAAALNTDRWNAAIVRGVLGNLRTAGISGFRGGRLEGLDLEEQGWQSFGARDIENLAPHYESWLWAVYIRLYDQTKYKPLLDKSKIALRRMMEGYPEEWNWTNGLQQERARLLLPLAWLVRIEDTEEHRDWLRTIATDLLAFQDESGAIHEELGTVGRGRYGPPKSNNEYGTREAPLIQDNGDPIADMLYTSNFALLSLNEAAAATNDPNLAKAAERLGEFLVRIQVTSADHPELDGAWFRAFDTERWTYWASNSDLGWGAWAIETGWTQSWITTVLALQELETDFWTFTSGMSLDGVFEEIRVGMGL